MRSFMLMTLAVVVCGIVGGCSSASAPAETGFLSDYSRLTPAGANSLRYQKGDLNQYDRFIIDPVQIHFHDEAEGSEIPPERAQELTVYMRGAIVKALEGGYEVVGAPGRGVARVRIAITDIKKASAALNVLPTTRITGLGLGGASVEAEIVDSRSGAQIAALVESKLAERLNLPAGWSDWGDAQSVMDEWAKRLRKRLDEAHGR